MAAIITLVLFAQIFGIIKKMLMTTLATILKMPGLPKLGTASFMPEMSRFCSATKTHGIMQASISPIQAKKPSNCEYFMREVMI